MFLQTLAMAGAKTAEGGDGGGAMGHQLIFMAFIVAIFYFLMIRPQQRREKERKAMLSAVKSGEQVLLSSGIIGEVRTVKDRTMLVRIAKDTEVEVIKSSVTQIIEKGETPEDVKA